MGRLILKEVPPPSSPLALGLVRGSPIRTGTLSVLTSALLRIEDAISCELPPPPNLLFTLSWCQWLSTTRYGSGSGALVVSEGLFRSNPRLLRIPLPLPLALLYGGVPPPMRGTLTPSLFPWMSKEMQSWSAHSEKGSWDSWPPPGPAYNAGLLLGWEQKPSGASHPASSQICSYVFF